VARNFLLIFTNRCAKIPLGGTLFILPVCNAEEPFLADFKGTAVGWERLCCDDTGGKVPIYRYKRENIKKEG